MTQSIAERIAQLPEMPKAPERKSHGYYGSVEPPLSYKGNSYIPDSAAIADYQVDLLDAIRARLSLAQDAIDAYLKALDARDSIKDYSDIEELRAVDAVLDKTEADLRLVRDMK